ncbi:D-threo-aldose 1-dehydrogenase [Planctomycetes bacterium CA13]|uniref:D-threo-aldose 1-dehydrogenase n=1 Tax=Novipirellula herctigrandis TaxID=2527986 RepID=A0A5C5ZAN6_9BACT|nr:D-threo-aldose 1-dehydrogenase [Planctomycetes bacterium CA13]
MEYRTLGATGLKVSVLGYGGSALSSFYDGFDEDRGIRAVRQALDLGINLLDTSPFYGFTSAETVLGKSLRGVSRDEYLLSTKVGRYGFEQSDCDYSAKRVSASIDESLARLGVDFVDFIQVHDAEFADIDQLVTETIPALYRARDAGKVRFVGVTGLPIQRFREILDRANVDQIQSYCHCCLNDTALLDLLPPLQERRIAIFNAAPFAMRLLNAGTLPDWHPAPQQLRIKCAEAAQYCAEKGSDLAKIALQYSVSHTEIPTTIVGTANPDRVISYVRHINDTLDTELLSGVLEILEPVHNLTWQTVDA